MKQVAVLGEYKAKSQAQTGGTYANTQGEFGNRLFPTSTQMRPNPHWLP